MPETAEMDKIVETAVSLGDDIITIQITCVIQINSESRKPVTLTQEIMRLSFSVIRK